MKGPKKKRVLVFGAAGMLGHKLYQTYNERFEVWGTLRCYYEKYAKYGIYNPENILGGVDVSDFDKIVEVIGTVQPDVVINCIGIIKQLPAAKDPIVSLKINSLFPHQLADLCRAANIRLFHISTDCVFSGSKGSYTEDDQSDATDLYGRTKFLGEIGQEGCLTLRSSIIGRELQTTNGLVEWFLSNRGGKVKGFKKAIYTGFTTVALSDIIANIIERHPSLSGVYNVSSEPIDKYTLLCLLQDSFGIEVGIEPDYKVEIDRSLDSRRFRLETGFQPPEWKKMIKEMAEDPTAYDKWHGVGNK